MQRIYSPAAVSRKHTIILCILLPSEVMYHAGMTIFPVKRQTIELSSLFETGYTLFKFSYKVAYKL
jgi:hypothetical protein